MRASLLILAIAAVGCAATPQTAGPAGRHAERIAAARPAGTPVSCVQIIRIRSSRVLSDRIIDFEMVDGSTYRNTLPYNCSGLGFDEAFSYSTSLTQLCSTDIITVLRQGGGVSRGASCGLGQFQPVTFPRRG